MGNANMKMPPTQAQLRGFHWARCAAAVPTLVASSLMIVHIVRSKTTVRRKTTSRILLAMASMDLLFACWAALGTTLNPRDAYPFLEYAVGTQETCDVSAFFLHGSSTASVIYNGALTLTYLLTIRYGWTDARLKQLEPWFHVIAHLCAWGTGVAALQMELYNPTGAECRIQEYPEGCTVDGNCIRGDNAGHWHLLFFFSFVWLVFVFICVAMYLIYQSVSTAEKRTEKYQYQVRSSQRSQTGSRPEQPIPVRRKLATQAVFYCFVFILTWIFGTFNAIFHESVLETSLIPILFLLIILEPMAGFFNALVYFRPRYIAYRQKMKKFKTGSDGQSGSGFRRNGMFHSILISHEDDEDETAEHGNQRSNASQEKDALEHGNSLEPVLR